MIETEIDLDFDLDQNLDLAPHINSKKTKNNKIKHKFLDIYHSNTNF